MLLFFCFLHFYNLNLLSPIFRSLSNFVFFYWLVLFLSKFTEYFLFNYKVKNLINYHNLLTITIMSTTFFTMLIINLLTIPITIMLTIFSYNFLPYQDGNRDCNYNYNHNLKPLWIQVLDSSHIKFIILTSKTNLDFVLENSSG